ncbi:hypothetical protein WA026_012751 [Henosepilachna vigintioctopunctata]|uniref:Gag protein n=1 Tax=Henosepilachna vigintioctopunctata TaxID=420089 RepID=A0AAW1U739_9CUCU
MPKFRINRLNQSQLNYELSIRGLQTGTVDKMRKTLSQAIKREKEGGSISYPNYPYTFEEDKEAIVGVVSRVEDSLSDPQLLSPASKRYTVNETRLAYALDRLDHIPIISIEQTTWKSQTFTRILELMDLLEGKLVGEKVQLKTVEPTEQLGSGDDSNSSDDEEDLRHSVIKTSTPETASRKERGVFVASTSFKVKPISVCRWDFKFSGEKDGKSFSAFLERLEELCEARGVSKHEAIRSGIDFSQEVRAEFEPYDYDDKLLDEIRHRTQGTDESIGLYLATMGSLFNRMKVPISEASQIRIVMRNILPISQTQLALVDVQSIMELKKFCRQLEQRREAVEAYDHH